jgi:amino acid adenylation domain-containing protein
VIGVNAPGRDHASLASVCGPVSRPIPHRLSVTAGATIADLARAVDADFADARQWGPYYAGGANAFPYTCSWEFWPADFGRPDPLLTLSARHVCVEPFTLHLTVAWIGDRLALDLGSDSTRVPRETVEHIEELLTTLIHHTLVQPDRTADTIDLLTPASRRRVLALSAGPSAAVPDGSLARLFEAQTAATPDRLAVVAERQSMTFRALDGASNRIARALRRLGAGPDVRVGLVVDRSADVLAGLIGILKAGAAYVPIDPADPIARWRGLGTGAAIAALVTPAPLAADTDLGVPVVRLPLGESVDDGPVAETAAGSNLAYVIFTSGSFGQPKAVGIEHRSVLNLLVALERAVYHPLGGRLRVAINAPLTFDASVKQWIQMLRGHTLCMVPEAIRYDALPMVPWLSESRVNVLDCTPAQLHTLIAAGLSEETVPSLKTVLVGGEAIDPALWEQLAGSTRIRFHNVYGPTECTVDTTTCSVQPDLEVPVIGRALAGVQTYVLDRRLELVPIGIAGELFVGGAGLARGYLNAPSLTAERFVPNVFDTTGGSRLYRTGDRVRLLDDGRLEFLDRLDRQIKIRGFRVEPGEIETALAAHAAVRAAMVRAEMGPDGLSRMAAYVVVPKGQTLKESDLRAFLRRTLPEFMVPDRIARVDHLPLTAHGKVDAEALAALARPLDRDAAIPPRNDLERTIADVWRDVLEIDAVGIDDNFFDVGGHSLVLARLHTRLRERLGREFAMVDLFRRPTISSFAAFLTDGADGHWSSAAIADRTARQKQAYRREQALRSKAP